MEIDEKYEERRLEELERIDAFFTKFYGFSAPVYKKIDTAKTNDIYTIVFRHCLFKNSGTIELKIPRYLYDIVDTYVCGIKDLETCVYDNILWHITNELMKNVK